MQIEKRIAEVERISVRLVASALLILALLSLLCFGTFEFGKFVSHLWNSF